MLLRTTDPFRDFDRLTQQLLGTTNRPAVMPMDAWREGDRFVIEFDLPGVNRDSIDLDVERNVLTVRAERVSRNGDWEMLASERPRGVFSRQLILGDNLDTERISANYTGGVLRLEIPVAEMGLDPQAPGPLCVVVSRLSQPKGLDRLPPDLRVHHPLLLAGRVGRRGEIAEHVAVQKAYKFPMVALRTQHYRLHLATDEGTAHGSKRGQQHIVAPPD